MLSAGFLPRIVLDLCTRYHETVMTWHPYIESNPINIVPFYNTYDNVHLFVPKGSALQFVWSTWSVIHRNPRKYGHR